MKYLFIILTLVAFVSCRNTASSEEMEIINIKYLFEGEVQDTVIMRTFVRDRNDIRKKGISEVKAYMQYGIGDRTRVVKGDHIYGELITNKPNVHLQARVIFDKYGMNTIVAEGYGRVVIEYDIR